MHGEEAGEADRGPPGIGDQPAQEEDFPVAPRHPAEGPLPQIDGHDKGIEPDREQDAGHRITLAQQPCHESPGSARPRIILQRLDRLNPKPVPLRPIVPRNKHIILKYVASGYDGPSFILRTANKPISSGSIVDGRSSTWMGGYRLGFTAI